MGGDTSGVSTARSHIESAFLKGATELNLGGIGLVSLPEEIGLLKNLTKLYLGNNKLINLLL